MYELSELNTFKPSKATISFTLSDKRFKGTLVNRESLLGGSFEITLTAYLILDN